MEGLLNLSLRIDDQEYTMMNISNMTREDLDYEQVKLMVELFKSNSKVLSGPAYTAIIIFTCS